MFGSRISLLVRHIGPLFGLKRKKKIKSEIGSCLSWSISLSFF